MYCPFCGSLMKTIRESEAVYWTETLFNCPECEKNIVYVSEGEEWVIFNQR